MSGFTGNDGSELVGGLNPSGVVKALSVDASGNLNVNASVSSGPTNITQVSSANVGPTNGLPISGNNSGALAVIAVDGSGRLILVPNTAFNMAQIAGVAPGLDNTNELRTSIYGKGNGAAGDTALLLDASGRPYVNVNSLPAIPAGSANIGGIEIFDSGGVNKLAIDASGRLTLVPNASVNVAQIAGVAPGLDNTNEQRVSLYGKGTNPGDTAIMLELTGALAGGVVTQDMIRRATIAGYAYSATTGKLTAPGAGTMGFQLFNPASGTKNILVYSIVLTGSAGSVHQLFKTAANVNSITGWSDVAATISNNGANATATTATASYSNVALTGGLLGTARELSAMPGNASIECMTNGECLWFPSGAGAISGLAVYMNPNGANIWGVTVGYIEF